MTTLTREALLGKSARRYMEVPLPSGGAVRIQSLNERERADYELSLFDKKNSYTAESSRRKLLVRCIVDESGNRMFADNEHDLLGDIDGADAGAIYDACQKHCGYQTGEVDKLAKKSDEATD